MAGNRRSGRRRLPTAVKRARGSRIRHDAPAEPAATPGIPPRPPHLDQDDLAGRAYDTIAARLLTQHVLTEAHGELVALMADAWAQYVRLQEAFAVLGRQAILVQEWQDQKGRVRRRVVENPLCRQMRQQALLLNTLMGEFGQTPASAPKVHAQAGAVDPLESFLTSGANVVPFTTRPRKQEQA